MSAAFLTSWEIISQIDIQWTGDVVIDYKLVLLMLIVTMIRTKRK